MNYPSIRIEGQIFSGELLQRLDKPELTGQKPADFGLPPDAKVKDEIARAWAASQAYYRAFRAKIANSAESTTTLHSLLTTHAPANAPSAIGYLPSAIPSSLTVNREPGTVNPFTSETRNLWIVPLLSLLGYNLEFAKKGEEINGKLFPISHRDPTRDQLPIHILGWNDSLDLRRQPTVNREPETVNRSPRMSPHALLQEYLNLTEHLWGIATNGRTLRLLRDSTRLVRQNLIEFDLERIFEEDLFADFAVLFRLLHATRMPKTQANTASCLLETYHQDALDQGARIRDGLRDAVEQAITLLGTGFLSNPANRALLDNLLASAQQPQSPADSATASALTPQDYYHHLLRLVYRFLFLLVAEERGLILAPDATRRQRDIYQQHYSLARLRRLAERPHLFEKQHTDLWQALLSTFRLFEFDGPGTKLGIAPLGGHLFAAETLGPLANATLSNADLLQVIRTLCFFQRDGRQLSAVNYGALATEEFGSVYESLLELSPVITGTTFSFRQVAGNERKTSGSYYTPDSLVQCLLDSALDPVAAEAVKGLRGEDAARAILKLKVCDPACGSGHFLVAAAHRLARQVAAYCTGEDTPSLTAVRHALREVVSHCIYGVDINPMSVELCKVTLWLEAMDPGKPLSFLDHHIQCGNSLLGATPASIAAGIPDAAYEPIAGDTKDAARWMRNLNRDARKGQASFDFSDAKPWDRLGNLPAAMAQMDILNDDTPEAIRAKEKFYHNIVEGSGYNSARLLHDTWCAAFVWPKNSMEYGDELTTEHLRKIERNPHSVSPQLKTKIRDLARQYKFFHWHLAFPTVFDTEGKGGFDAILGNPPWDMQEVKDNEFFASSYPEILSVKSAKDKTAILNRIRENEPSLWQSYQEYVRITYGQKHLMTDSGCFPLSGNGRMNLYRLFVEVAHKFLAHAGRVGLVVPSGFASDSFSQDHFAALHGEGRLISLFDFENRLGLFPNVHSSYRFCLLTIGGKGACFNTDFVFFAHSPLDLTDSNRHIKLSQEAVSALNPLSRTAPLFRSRTDYALTIKMHEDNPIIGKSNDERNWGIKPALMFMMNADMKGHRTAEELEAAGCLLDGNRYLHGSDVWLPFYEGKMVGMYDHRAASIRFDPTNRVRRNQPVALSDAEHKIPTQLALPMFWVRSDDVAERCTGLPKWCLTVKDVTASTNERTAIAAILPSVALTDSLPWLRSEKPAKTVACLLANLNAFAFDYVARQKVAGLHLRGHYLNQLPLIGVPTIQAKSPWLSVSSETEIWILSHVLELTYTAWDLEPFAKDCGYDGPPFKWDEERRFLLRCELDAAFFHLYLPATPEGGWKPAGCAEGAVHAEPPALFTR